MYPRAKQTGFSLIMAIFLIVVLGGIAVFIGRITSMQLQSSNLDQGGSSAYQAARAGIEWGVYQAHRIIPSCAADPVSFSPSPGVGLANFIVSVTCHRSDTNEVGYPYIYTLTATSCNQPLAGACPNAGAVGSLTYIERQLTVILTGN
jgi:MSHA biogenesis protein MshP